MHEEATPGVEPVAAEVWVPAFVVTGCAPMGQRGSSSGLLGKIGRHVGGGIVDGIVDGVRQPRDPLLDLLPRQRSIAEQNGPAGQRRRHAHLNAGGRKGIDADPRAQRGCLHRHSVRNAWRRIPDDVQSSLVALDRDIAEIATQRVHETVAAFLVVRAQSQQMRRIAASPDEVGERCLLKPRSAIAEQTFFGPHRFSDRPGNDHVTDAQSAAERFGERPEIDGAIGRQRRDRREMRSLVAYVAVVIVLEHVAAISSRPGNDLGAPVGRKRSAGRILVRWRQIEQRRRSVRQSIRDQAVAVDGHTCNFGPRRFERRDGALIAGIFDNAERAARQKQSRRDRQAFLHPGNNYDPRGVGDNAARCRQMIGNRRAQRGKPRRIAVLRQARRAAVGKVRLHQTAPGLERKQFRAGPARKEIEQQAITGRLQGVFARVPDAKAAACKSSSRDRIIPAARG